MCVLLVDTQGLFDGFTGQHLTTSIFGLSTLLSSYQIYNIDKRLQEDNLQHLALFSEYSRVVFNGDDSKRLSMTLSSLQPSPIVIGLSSGGSCTKGRGDRGPTEADGSFPATRLLGARLAELCG